MRPVTTLCDCCNGYEETTNHCAPCKENLCDSCFPRHLKTFCVTAKKTSDQLPTDQHKKVALELQQHLTDVELERNALQKRIDGALELLDEATRTLAVNMITHHVHVSVGTAIKILRGEDP